MTPAAMTPAGRAAARAPARKAPRALAHAPAVRTRPAPPVPRRVSGPARPVRARRAPTRTATFSDRAAEFIRGLPDHSLLDRIVRGRAWIPLLGVMLAGIVAMQVEVLKLTASMGRSIALSNTLQGRNGVLRTSVSALSDAQRIERLATRMGMLMPAPISINFLHARVNPSKAAGSIHPPDTAAFGSALQASASQTSATTAPSSQPSSSTTTATTTTPGATTPSTAPTSAGATTATTNPAATPTAATPNSATPTAAAPAVTSVPSATGGAAAAP